MLEIRLDSAFVSGNVKSYDKIAKIHNDIRISIEKKIKLVIEIDERIGLPLLFYISTIPFICEKYDKEVFIYCNNKMVALFEKGGYIEKGLHIIQGETDISEILKKTSRVIVSKEDIFEIVTDITAEAPVEMSEKLSEIFISKVGEMFNNAREHSEAQYVIGAKYFKNQKNKYCFSCYDTGVGIPNKVKSTKLTSDDVKALHWAMQKGNSTANLDGLIPRGLGLDLLHSFAKANDGAIRICSGKALYVYKKSKGVKYYSLEFEFEGTLFEMDIIADNNHKYIIS